MLAQIQPEQAHEPKDNCNGDGCKKEFGVVKERQRIVAQKGDYEVVDQRCEVKRVA